LAHADPLVIRSLARRIHEHVATFGLDAVVLVTLTPDPLEDDGVDVPFLGIPIGTEASLPNS